MYFVKNETSDTVTVTVNLVEEFNIDDKGFFFFGGNKSTDFGGAQNCGKHYFLTNLKSYRTERYLELTVTCTKLRTAPKQAAGAPSQNKNCNVKIYKYSIFMQSEYTHTYTHT